MTLSIDHPRHQDRVDFVAAAATAAAQIEVELIKKGIGGTREASNYILTRCFIMYLLSVFWIIPTLVTPL